MTNTTTVSTWYTMHTAKKRAESYQKHSTTYDYHVEPGYDDKPFDDVRVFRVIATPRTTFTFKVTVDLWVDASSPEQAIETVQSLNLYADFGVEYDIVDAVKQEG